MRNIKIKPKNKEESSTIQQIAFNHGWFWGERFYTKPKYTRLKNITLIFDSEQYAGNKFIQYSKDDCAKPIWYNKNEPYLSHLKELSYNEFIELYQQK